MITVTIAGRVGRDAELRNAPSGDAVLNFSVAVSKRGKDGERTLWVDCAIWGKRGEALAQYVTKGSAVTVCGDLDVREYDKRDGTRGFSLTCRVQEITLQGSKGERAQTETAPTAASGGQSGGQSEAPKDFDDDIPFAWIALLPLAPALLHVAHALIA